MRHVNAATRTDSRFPLALALAFAYPAAVALVRLVAARRAVRGARAGGGGEA
jgi:hypothetical protein